MALLKKMSAKAAFSKNKLGNNREKEISGKM